MFYGAGAFRFFIELIPFLEASAGREWGDVEASAAVVADGTGVSSADVCPAVTVAGDSDRSVCFDLSELFR
jgi:hypothetical protein